MKVLEKVIEEKVIEDDEEVKEGDEVEEEEEYYEEDEEEVCFICKLYDNATLSKKVICKSFIVFSHLNYVVMQLKCLIFSRCSFRHSQIYKHQSMTESEKRGIAKSW